MTVSDQLAMNYAGTLEVDADLLDNVKRVYSKKRVHPFSIIQLSEGKTRGLLVNGFSSAVRLSDHLFL